MKRQLDGFDDEPKAIMKTTPRELDHGGDAHRSDYDGVTMRKKPAVRGMPPPKVVETPRIWKSGNAMKENVSRREKRSMKNPFSPQARFFSIHQHLKRSGEKKQTRIPSKVPVVDKDCIRPASDNISTDPPAHPQNSYKAPTVLHRLCHTAQSANDLQKIPTWDDPKLADWAFQKDKDGYLPLHILSYNKTVSHSVSKYTEECMDDAQEILVQDFLVDFLIPANPFGMTTEDDEGYVPFEHTIVQWIGEGHSDHDRRAWKTSRSFRNGQKLNSNLSIFQPAVGTFLSKSREVISRATSSLPFGSPGLVDQVSDNNSSDLPIEVNLTETFESNESAPADHDSIELELGTSHKGRGLGGEKVATDKTKKQMTLDLSHQHESNSRTFPKNVQLTTHIAFTLQILSRLLEVIGGATTNEYHGKDRSVVYTTIVKDENDCDKEVVLTIDSIDLMTSFVERIASIPDFMKTLLLIEDDTERNRALSYPFVKRTMLRQSSVGQWMVFMLQHSSKTVAHRAVEYLRILSDLSANDEHLHLGVRTDILREEDELNDKISKLDGLIPSLLSLDEKKIEEAATTIIVSKVLDKMISSPFAVAVVFFDALFLSLLLLGFRVSINGYLNGMDPKVVFTWIYIANTGIFYFVIRELGKAISLCMITRGAFFHSYFWSFWNIVDILATGLALGSTTAMRLNLGTDISVSNDLLRALLAITTGLLWLRVLGLLKTVNMQLATFVLATVQITRDILWFLLILLTAVVAFSQMFYTILLPSGCSTGETAADQCNQAEYYLRVYSILLGDFGEFDRSDFSTVLSVTLAVFFTFMVVLVLLNVLIAIVSDSYEKCLVRSQFLFGRARVMLLAELVSFQNLLRTNSGADLETRDLPNRKWIGKTWKNGWTRGSMVFYCCSGLVLIAWMMGEIAGHLSGERYGNIRFSICSIVVNVLLLIAILIFLTKGAADGDVRSKKNSGPKRFWTRWYEGLIQKAMLRLLGASKHNSSLSRVEENDEWRGRAQYLQKEMTRISAENLASTRIHVRGLENQIKHADSRTNAEIVALEEQVRNVEDSIKIELMETEKRIQQMIELSVNQMRDLLQSERPTELMGTRGVPSNMRVGRRPHYNSMPHR